MYKTVNGVRQNLPRAEQARRRTEHARKLEAWKQQVSAQQTFLLDKAQQSLVDQRASLLPDHHKEWMKGAKLRPMAKQHKLKAHDWHVCIQSGLPYLLHGLLPEHAADTFARFCAMVTRLVEHRSTKEEDIRELKTFVVETLCLYERDFPASELAVSVHAFLHFPEMIMRWGNVRNYWCYFNERCFHVQLIH